MIDPKQFRAEIIYPVLENLNRSHVIPYSLAAEQLLLGTALVESSLTYLRQSGGGPALGVYQIEPNTYEDIVDWIDDRFNRGAYAYTWMHDQLSPYQQLKGNLHFATFIARMIYYRAPTALPPAGDLPALAAYWKEHYNTPLGRGDPDTFRLKLAAALPAHERIVP